MPKRSQRAKEITPNADKRAATMNNVAAMIRQELSDDSLEPWAKEFCAWLARNPFIKSKRQLEAASALAGTDIAPDQLKRLKLRRAWRRLWKQYRDAEAEQVAKAREKYAAMLPKAAGIYDDMLDRIKESEGLDGVRAAPPLLVPMLERAWPKQVPQAVTATQVNISLTPEQWKAIDQPELTVTAEEVIEIHATTPRNLPPAT